MRYTFSEEQNLLRSSLDKFLASMRAKRSTPGFQAAGVRDRGIWQGLAELGVLGLPFPERFGGSGGTALDVLVVMEAFGRAQLTEPFLGAIVLAGGALRHCATEAQQAELIPPLANGERLYALAFAEQGARFNLADVSVSAAPAEGGYTLNGRKIVVVGAPDADALLVTARTSGGPRDRDGISLFVVPRDAPGLTMRSYLTVDGFRAADVTLEEVAVAPEAMLGSAGGALQGLEQAVNEAIAASCAEVVGILAALNERTLEHCRTRNAFGQPLSKFQVLQHRLVDMHTAYEYAGVMTLRLTEALCEEGSKVGTEVVSAAKYQVGQEADLVGKAAVQLHGAMGITEEIDIGQYFKRLTCLRAMFGVPEHHLRRYADARRAAGWKANRELELELSDSDRAFQAEVREFFAQNLTEPLREAARLTLWAFAEFEYGVQWQKALHAKGWGAPDWPIEYGGCDWTPTQRLIWALETARAGPPEVMRQGKNLCAPCIMRFGTEQQKAEFLPGILRGDDWWAQGYSEPGAGSDLASLQTSAVSDGDDYIVNGSKIWTTFGHHANRMFCLVRTDNTGKKQAGITFLLIDMDTPGIEVRPIINLAGAHEFNQVFFTDVRVPKSRRLGEENQGWEVGRHLLRFEHGGLLVQANLENRRRIEWLTEVAGQESNGEGRSLLDDPDFARQLSEVEIGLQAIEFAAKQVLAKKEAAVPLPMVSELLNLRNRETVQRLTQLAVDAVGYYALPLQHDAIKVDSDVACIGPEHVLLPTALFLSQRAQTIAGGTAEIHRNNLARRHLNL